MESWKKSLENIAEHGMQSSFAEARATVLKEDPADYVFEGTAAYAELEKAMETARDRGTLIFGLTLHRNQPGTHFTTDKWTFEMYSRHEPE